MPLIVFDLDGTLIDSRVDLANAANALIGELGGAPKPVAAITAMGVESIIWIFFPWNRASDAAGSSCDQCRIAAEAGGIAPLGRVAHNSEGPRFLYRCGACNGYWVKDVKGMRPISVLRVRQDFPSVLI